MSKIVLLYCLAGAWDDFGKIVAAVYPLNLPIQNLGLAQV